MEDSSERPTNPIRAILKVWPIVRFAGSALAILSAEFLKNHYSVSFSDGSLVVGLLMDFEEQMRLNSASLRVCIT